MASSNVCWGIEIGAAAIKAVKLENLGEAGVRVLEYANILHPKPLSSPDVNPNDVLRVSLGALTSQFDLTKSQIAISVPGHAAFARFAKLPPVEPKKVPDIVKFEAMQQIPFPLDQVEWDYQTFTAPDSPDIEVGIFAITREKVLEKLQMCADVGITPNYVVLSPIAVYNALAYDLGFDTSTAGTIIVDVGTTSTDLVIATPGRMWIRTFPIGGHQFTEALVQQFNLRYPQAEKLKREAEDSKHARQVFQAMRPSFTNLAQDIQRSIGYFQSLNRDANLTRLIGVGSTFLLPGLRKYLKQQLGIDVYRVEEFKKLQAPGELAKRIKEDSLTLTTAYGLALQGLGLNAVGGNLMPISVLRKSLWKEKVPYFGIAAGVALVAGAAMFALPARDYFQAKEAAKPPVISEALNKHRQLKAEADEAGVLGGAEADMKAANIIAMLDKRGVFQSINRDIASMFEAGTKRAPGWAKEQQSPEPPAGPAFVLRNFTTTYMPPAVAASSSDSMDSGGTPGAAAAANDPVSAAAAFPRIQIKLSIDTQQPEPRKFVDATIGKWLAANKLRADLPYEIVTASRPYTVTEAGKEAASDPNSGSYPGDTMSSRRRSDGEMIERRGRSLGIPGSSNVVMLEDGTIGERATIVAGGILIGGPASTASAGDQDLTKRRAEATAQVDKLANLGDLRSQQPQANASSVVVDWYVVFKPPAPPTPPDEETSPSTPRGPQ